MTINTESNLTRPLPDRLSETTLNRGRCVRGGRAGGDVHVSEGVVTISVSGSGKNTVGGALHTNALSNLSRRALGRSLRALMCLSASGA